MKNFLAILFFALPFFYTKYSAFCSLCVTVQNWIEWMAFKSEAANFESKPSGLNEVSLDFVLCGCVGVYIVYEWVWFGFPCENFSAFFGNIVSLESIQKIGQMKNPGSFSVSLLEFLIFQKIYAGKMSS